MTPEHPEISEALEPWVERIIDRALLKHEISCPLKPRMRTLELRFATLLGWMAGAGFCGGIAYSVLTWLMPFIRKEL